MNPETYSRPHLSSRPSSFAPCLNLLLLQYSITGLAQEYPGISSVRLPTVIGDVGPMEGLVAAQLPSSYMYPRSSITIPRCRPPTLLNADPSVWYPYLDVCTGSRLHIGVSHSLSLRHSNTHHLVVFRNPNRPPLGSVCVIELICKVDRSGTVYS